jgi:hypothetical protein
MSKDKEHIVEFIKNVCNKDLAQANKSLHAAVTEKVKDRIRVQEKNSKPDYMDVDEDGDEKEPMKKALKDKEEGKCPDCGKKDCNCK